MDSELDQHDVDQAFARLVFGQAVHDMKQAFSGLVAAIVQTVVPALRELAEQLEPLVLELARTHAIRRLGIPASDIATVRFAGRDVIVKTYNWRTITFPIADITGPAR